MEGKMDRRHALGAFGAVSLSGLLAACGGDETASSGTVTTTTGTTSTVETKTMTSKATAELFEESARCT